MVALDRDTVEDNVDVAVRPVVDCDVDVNVVTLTDGDIGVVVVGGFDAVDVSVGLAVKGDVTITVGVCLDVSVCVVDKTVVAVDFKVVVALEVTGFPVVVVAEAVVVTEMTKLIQE